MIPTHNKLSLYQRDSPFERQWSIRQANSRLQSHTLENALQTDLNRNLEEKPSYLSSTPMTQQPSRHKSQDPFQVAPMEAWQEIKDYNLRVNGLPTLDQMMRLNTYSPLTQSNFATFLRKHHVHQNLNFLMELDTHDKLWRAYLQSLDRQNRQRLSQFLESAAESTVSFTEIPDTDDLLAPLPLTPKSDEGYASRINHSFGHHDLVQNATRIYRTYCSPKDAAQLIHLPDDHRRALEELIELNDRPEPIIFDSARTHVFSILNVFYYPLFVDNVLYKNISTGTCRLFLILGFILLTLAFSVELSLIFLDAGKLSTRWAPIVPFFVGWSFLLSSITEFAWWFGVSSTRYISLEYSSLFLLI